MEYGEYENKPATEEYDHMSGLGQGHGVSIHESYPDIGDGLTEEHGSPSEMHEDGVHRFIGRSPSDMILASTSDNLPNPFMPSKPSKGSKGKPKPIKPTPLPPNEY